MSSRQKLPWRPELVGVHFNMEHGGCAGVKHIMSYSWWSHCKKMLEVVEGEKRFQTSSKVRSSVRQQLPACLSSSCGSWTLQCCAPKLLLPMADVGVLQNKWWLASKAPLHAVNSRQEQALLWKTC